ncbi:hypothetical protein B0G77_5297 [Paraburkholderia sp. BL10I2N1]|nr:hypothetical protein B0G77_5297 [Paraburkholderia sp. BL10I2N1]
MHNLLETPLVLLAGLLTIASPCILPVMPILLGTSVDRPSRVRPRIAALFPSLKGL